MPTPDRIGRYAVRRRIGSGGFATVWLGYDEQLDAPVAIKVLADNWTEQYEVRTRFLEEGRYLRRVESAHVVPVYDAGTLEDGRPYLVMAYADQGTLSDRLTQGAIDPAQALEVVRQVGLGLQALHDRGVLHRDLKPANVLFRTVDPTAGPDGVRAMVGDLGLGKALDVSSRLTMVAGTPAYVAPEQAQGEPLDARADQYSLGVLTFLLLGGRLPYSHSSLPQAAAPGEPPPLGTDERPVPVEVEQVVRRALAHDRQWRWPTVTAYVDALAAEVAHWSGQPTDGTRVLPLDPALTQPGQRPSAMPSDGPLPDPVPPAPPRRRRRVVRASAIAALLVVAAAGGVAAGYWGEGLRGDSDAEVTVDDASGTLSVTVPPGWDVAEAVDGWVPPNVSDRSVYAAVSVGSSAQWAGDDDGEGVFAGLLPSAELPSSLPGHPECESTDAAEMDAAGDDAFMTAVSAGCPGGVTVERVVQVSQNQLLWIQVRTHDRAAANRVLDGVQTHGL